MQSQTVIPNNTTDTLMGVVQQTSQSGIKLDGKWFNYSKYDQVAHPSRGQMVQVEAKNNFIKALTIMSGDKTSAAPEADRQDVVITRLAVLKAAAAFGASRPDLRSADVLQVAELWERWATR